MKIIFNIDNFHIILLDSWEKNWIYSEHPGQEFGKFILSHGKFWNDPDNDKGNNFFYLILLLFCIRILDNYNSEHPLGNRL